MELVKILILSFGITTAFFWTVGFIARKVEKHNKKPN